MSFRHNVSYKYSQKERTNKHREHFCHYLEESDPECDAALWIQNRHNRRHSNRCHKIYEHCIRHQCSGISAQLLSKYSSSCGCRTDETNHRRLQRDSTDTIWVKINQNSRQQENKYLKCQSINMPALPSQIADINLTERDEQHRENQYRLDYRNDISRIRTPLHRHRKQEMPYQITCRAKNHSARQGPISQKSYNRIHFSIFYGRKISKKSATVC